MQYKLDEIKKHVEKVYTVNSSNPFKDSSFVYIDLSSIDQATKKITNPNFLQTNEAPSRAKQIVRTGDVLVATVRPNLNSVALVTEEYDGAIASTGFSVLRTDRKSLDNQYLFHWVKTSNFIKDMISKVSGANYPAVSDRIIKDSFIPLPPLEEQKRIADILDKSSLIIQKRKESLQLADDFIKSVFLEMFGDPVTNPMGWEVEKLNTHLTISGGYSFKSESYNKSGIPILRIGNINLGYFSEKNLVFSEYDERLKKYLILPGDLLMSLTGTVGKDDYGNVCIIDDSYECYYLNQRNAKLNLLSTLNKYYLRYCLQFPDVKKILTGVSRGIRQANISNSDILNLSIQLPPLELQNKFAQIVQEVEKTKEKLQIQLDEAETLFKALQQQFFEG